MKLVRIRYLIPLHCRELFNRTWWFGLVLLIMAVIMLFIGVGWDGERPTLFGTPELNIAPSNDRQNSITLQIASYMSAVWLIAMLAFAVPVVLVPLSASFSLTQTCWLRGLRCSPREVACSRAVRLISAVLATAIIGVFGSVILAFKHDLQVTKLATVILGWASHLLMSGAIVLSIGPYLVGSAHRITATFIAMLFPIMLWLGSFLMASPLAEVKYACWLPYACPYTENFDYAARHYAMSLVIGIVLTILSVIRAKGSVILTDSILGRTV